MKTEFKHIRFVQSFERWNCYSTKGVQHLGTVDWFPKWKKYCFFPSSDCVFDEVCLEDVMIFLHALNEEHKKKKVS